MDMNSPNNSAIDLTSTASEYSLVIGNGFRPVVGLQIQCRTANNIRISFTAGGTANGEDYFTLKSGSVYYEDNLKYLGSIYIRPETNSTVAEVIWWQ